MEEAGSGMDIEMARFQLLLQNENEIKVQVTLILSFGRIFLRCDSDFIGRGRNKCVSGGGGV